MRVQPDHTVHAVDASADASADRYFGRTTVVPAPDPEA
jgi:hypothetical protein